MDKVTIANRQRRHVLVKREFQAMFEQLWEEVCRNLRSRPAVHINDAVLAQIESRGLVNVVFVSNRKIQELNLEWRNQDRPTDVLSFPVVGTFDRQESGSGVVDFPLRDEEPFELGDVVISIDKAKQQADDFGHSLKREIAFLFIHGSLHILGFDHHTGVAEEEMFLRQGQILNNAGFPREPRYQ